MGNVMLSTGQPVSPSQIFSRSAGGISLMRLCRPLGDISQLSDPDDGSKYTFESLCASP